MKDLKNKVVWISGASSGIGEGIAYEMAKEGAKLVLSARRKEELERVAKACSTSPENIYILPIDLTKTEKATEWAKQVIDHFGQIDILINNGGISQNSLALETKEEIERQIMEINYFGNVNLTKAVVPYMQQQKSGKIVVTTSIVGKFGLPTLASYSASKHALYGYYDSLRMELKDDNVSVLLISPGFIKTDVNLNAVTGDGSLNMQNSPAQENGMPTDVFAKRAVKAIKGSANHKLIGRWEVLSVPFKATFTNLFYRIMTKISKSSKK